MTRQDLLPIFLLLVLLWIFFSRSKKKSNSSVGTPSPSNRKPYILKTAPSPPSAALVTMPEASTRLLTYRDELLAAQARQRMWLRYEDRAGNTTERTIEIYHPEDDEYVFAWCCSKLEPRTFARRSIRSWRLLPERFEFDPIIEQYWREEGTRDQSEKLPWKRWINKLPGDVASRYQHTEGLTLTYVPSTGQSFSSERPATIPAGPRWWEMRDEALLKYSQISSDALADYQPIILLIEGAIAAGASVSSQARLYRVLGEIFHHCGDKAKAIPHFERALKLDPEIGIKKLLARLKAETSA